MKASDLANETYVVPATLNDLAQEAYEIAESKGWYDGDVNIPERLALIHSEVSEALTEFRKNPDVLHTYYREEDGKPEGFAFELADIILRTLSLAAAKGIDIQLAASIKSEFNRTRPYKHGDKSC